MGLGRKLSEGGKGNGLVFLLKGEKNMKCKMGRLNVKGFLDEVLMYNDMIYNFL